MKSCPVCHRTFSDETLSFCLVDGSILSAPYDPQATIEINNSDAAHLLTTEIIPPAASPDPSPSANEKHTVNKEKSQEMTPKEGPSVVPSSSPDKQLSPKSDDKKEKTRHEPISISIVIKITLALIVSLVAAVIVNVSLFPYPSPIDLLIKGALVNSILAFATGFLNVWGPVTVKEEMDKLDECIWNSVPIIITWGAGAIIGILLSIEWDFDSLRILRRLIPKAAVAELILIGVVVFLSSWLGILLSPFRRRAARLIHPHT
jgi:hypothetical protein